MKRFLILALIVFAAWYGWNHRDRLLSRQPRHDAVIVNHSGRGIERVRLTVGNQTLVKEAIPDEGSATMSFGVSDDSDFLLVWQWKGSDAELHWRGGRVPRGPMVQRHTMIIDGDGGVTYQAENKLGS